MNINRDSMQKVADINKRSMTTPDLRYSESTERWTMNEEVQSTLGLDNKETGLVMYLATDDSGQQVVLVEVNDKENSDFFTGKGNVFTAHRLADAVSSEDNQYSLKPVDEMENTYAVTDWDGESEILSNLPTNEEDDDENEQNQIESDLSEFGETVDDQEEEFAV